jgi:hypothetical protein
MGNAQIHNYFPAGSMNEIGTSSKHIKPDLLLQNNEYLVKFTQIDAEHPKSHRESPQKVKLLSVSVC